MHATPNLLRQSKLHARTLAVLNHCVGTARRDAAGETLFLLTDREDWPQDQGQCRQLYEKGLQLVREILSSTRRSSPILYNSRLAFSDRPVLHFFHLFEQLLQTLHSLAQHVEEMQHEAELLSELLGEDAWNTLRSTGQDFEIHEREVQKALRKIIPIGRMLLAGNSQKRRDAFTSEEKRRYDKAYAEYIRHDTDGVLSPESAARK